MRRMMAMAAGLALLCGTAAGAGALTAAEKCEAAKLKEAGKYGFCRLKAEAKAVKTGAAPDYSKCDDKYGLKWPAIESAGGGMCPSNGDQAAIGAFITQHTDDLAAALGGGGLPTCATDLATCTTDLGTCSGDLATCNTTLTTTSASLAACTGDLATCTTDLATCTTDLAAALTCGNGVVDGGEDCDQANLGGATCLTEGFAGGTLACGSGCAFETAGCWAARFVDNADGTVSDRQTGLKWEKKTELNGVQNLANPFDADNLYRWAGTCSIATSKRCQPTAAAAALCAANAEHGTTGCDQCTGGDGTCSATSTAWTLAADRNAATFGGHTDWRVPTRAELISIVDYADLTFSPVTDAAFHGASCGAACTDVTSPACACTRSDYYWSASSLAPSPPYAWIVFFNNGYVVDGDKTGDLYVRLVRGGS
jgi:hypothetical protein